MSVDFIASLHCKAMLWTMTFLKFNESEDRVNRLIISIINVLMGSCTASHGEVILVELITGYFTPNQTAVLEQC